LKDKNAFEASGNSPTATVRVSIGGAPVLTGRGLAETKRRIVEAFEKIRQHSLQHSEPTPPSQVEWLEYTEHHKTRFHERAKRLSLAALEGSHIPTTRNHVFEIEPTTQTAEELIREALWLQNRK
jgi:hypothetical protein